MKKRNQGIPVLEEIRLTKKVLWKSVDGLFVVVAGPFPRGFVRSLTAPDVDSARLRPNTDIQSRMATTNGHPAKTRASLITDVENEWGEVSP